CIAKAPEDWRTPKPGGNASDCGQRASVLECGGPTPLSMQSHTRDLYGSWKYFATLMPCIGTINLDRVGKCRQQGAADVSSAELLPGCSAGKMPAAPSGSWNGLHERSTAFAPVRHGRHGVGHASRLPSVNRKA